MRQHLNARKMTYLQIHCPTYVSFMAWETCWPFQSWFYRHVGRGLGAGAELPKRITTARTAPWRPSGAMDGRTDVAWTEGVSSWTVGPGPVMKNMNSNIGLSYLVGGLEPWNFMIFPYWEFHHPNWRTPSFFRGVAKNHQPRYLLGIYGKSTT